MGKRRRGKQSSLMEIPDIIDDESLSVCIMGNLRGIKEARLIRDFEACEGYAGVKKIKKAVSLNFGHMEFETKEQKEKTLNAIKGIVLKNKPLGFSVKREQIREPKKQRLNAEDIEIKDVVTPLWKMSYEDQLKHKARFVNQSLYHITKQTREDSKHAIPDWVANIKNMRGPCCEYDLTVVPSPTLYHYRNKSSFSAGLDISENPLFGFSLGAVKNGIDCVADPSECCHVSHRSLEIRKIMNDFMKQSGLPVYNKTDHAGFWRRLTVKTFSTGEGLVIVEVDPSALSEEKVKETKESLVKLFKENSINESLCYLPWSGLSNFADDEIPIECLSGPPYAHEILFDLKFRISPSAFFQVNTKGAEVLYDIIKDWCNVSEKSTVIDICCGTGSISLCLAKSIKHITGVEMNPSAIRDAKLNAELNGITNAEFIVGKAEDVVPGLLEKYSDCEEFIAVVDPPRAGLHKSVIKAIRDCSFIKKIVFVSCDHTNGLLHNGSALCRATSNASPGIPFKPVKVTAVDMFPHTDCVEVVMLFERDTSVGTVIAQPEASKESTSVIETKNESGCDVKEETEVKEETKLKEETEVKEETKVSECDVKEQTEGKAETKEETSVDQA